MEQVKRIAVLIDSDNTSHAKLNYILEKLENFGKIVVKRAYGDFSSDYLKNWKDPLNKLAIQPRQQFAYTTGKNSTDSVMIIEAMDLLYSSRFDMFALVSSDSDFTSLATRLRESELEVVGVGKTITPISFKNACDNFISIETLGVEAEEEYLPLPKSSYSNANSIDEHWKHEEESKGKIDKSINSLWDLMINAWYTCKKNNRWAMLSDMEISIKKKVKNFDVQDYGLETLVDFFNDHPDRYEIFPVDGDVEVKYIKNSSPNRRGEKLNIMDLVIPEQK